MEMNKENLIQFGKVAGVALLGLLAIISNAAVWNAGAEGCSAVPGFIVGVSVLNFLAEGFGIYKLAKKWIKF